MDSNCIRLTCGSLESYRQKNRAIQRTARL
jgi:hypothetical protein